MHNHVQLDYEHYILSDALKRILSFIFFKPLQVVLAIQKIEYFYILKF